jgi:flavodoxin
VKVLVVYYSLEGNTRLIARSIAAETYADLLELQPVRQPPPRGMGKYVQGLGSVFRKDMPPLQPFITRPGNYDLIFLGTPVWAGTYASAYNTYFSQVEIVNRKVALFCCHRGHKGQVFENMTSRLAGNEIVGTIDFNEPACRDTEAAQARARSWARAIKDSLTVAVV